MEKMFYNCELQVLDISSFVTNKVKSFSNMFQNCRLLKKIDTSKFETSMATEMAYIF
jgi:surface protein